MCGLLLGARSLRRPPFSLSTGVRIEILSVYTSAMLSLLIMWLTSGYVQPAKFRALFGLASIADVAVVVAAVAIGSGLLMRFAFVPNRPAPLRYLVLGLLC